MARSMMAGMSDYSHQSFEDLIEDLIYWKDFSNERAKRIEENIKQLESDDYWKKVPIDFQNEIYCSRMFFTTVVSEISSIISDLQNEVQENHINRLYALAQTADKMNVRIGKTWHADYQFGWKKYGNDDFRAVEDLYSITRDLVASLTDLSNIGVRLKDFIGKKKKEESSKSILNSATFGDNATVCVGDHNTIITTKIKVSEGNMDALKKALIENKVSLVDVDELEKIIETDKPNNESKTFGEGVSNWIGKMVTKAAQNVWSIGIEAAGSLLAQLLNQYYGWI